MGSWDLNSEPQACAVSALLTELSPHPGISSLKVVYKLRKLAQRTVGAVQDPGKH